MAFFAHPRFDAFTIRLSNPGADAQPLAATLGAGWSARPVPDQPGVFDLEPPAATPIDVGTAWSLTYALRARAGVVHAEPVFELTSDNTPETAEDPAFDLRVVAHDPPPIASEDDVDWLPRLIGADRVWARGVTGAGVRIAHPDSGYSPHEQLDAGRIDLARARDYVDEDGDPDGPPHHVSHGVSTASVIVSGHGDGPLDVRGVAPGATLIPLRVTKKHGFVPAPVLFGAGARRLRDAISHARVSGCHVVSISLGWFKNESLRTAIREAIDADLIVLAAAGNYVRIVTWPAAYDEVIAVAGCTAARETWWGSSRGDAVDITAPAHNVWRAYLESDGRAEVAPSSGTSYGVAATAGVAALWLARHGGWDAVRARYPDTTLQDVFRHVLLTTCDPPPAGHDGNFGRGIVNADRAVELLPDPADVRDVFAVDRGLPTPDGFALLKGSLGAPAVHIADPTALADFADEVAFHVLTTPALREAWLATPPTARRVSRRTDSLLARWPTDLFPARGAAAISGAARPTLEAELRDRASGLSPQLRALL